MSKNKNPDQTSNSEKESSRVASDLEQDSSSSKNADSSVEASASKTTNDVASVSDSITNSPAAASEEINSFSKSESASKTASSNSSNKASKSKATQANKKSSILMPVLVLFLIVSLAGVGGLGYLAWQQVEKERQKIADLEERVNLQSQQLSQQFSTTSNTLRDLENQLQTQSQNFAGYDQQAQQLEDELERQLQGYREQLLTQSTTSNDDWKLAEAYYLTRLAVQRLQMEKSTIGALALLQAADDIVKSQKDPELFRVREALADDMATLQLAGSVDREGIYLQIAAIIKQLENLPSLTPDNFQDLKDIEENNNAQIEDLSDTGEGTIKNSFNKALKHLQSYFRIRHAEADVDISMPIQSGEIAKVRLRMLLESAQIALLREESEIFKDSLAKAKELVSLYFPAENSKNGDLQAEKLSVLIEKIQNEPIEQSIPSIQQSQKVLGDYLEKLHKVKPLDDSAIRPNPAPVQNLDASDLTRPETNDPQATVAQ